VEKLWQPTHRFGFNKHFNIKNPPHIKLNHANYKHKEHLLKSKKRMIRNK
jgi:hypothetical protein